MAEAVNGKIGGELSVALDVPENVLLEDEELSVGYEPAERRWELIVKYNGDVSEIESKFNAEVVRLSAGYAIITIGEQYIQAFSDLRNVEFIEKPKLLYNSVADSKTVSCISQLQTSNTSNIQTNSSPTNLFGEGVLVAIIDSGIDYSHPDFRNDDGTTRILALWDQTIPGNAPDGYNLGTLYTDEDINEALEQNNISERLKIVPSIDISGHGTHVAGIACGNGRASGGKFTGVASKSQMLVVKLGSSVGESFPRTTRLMEAINFVSNYALSLNIPIAINISFGNNYGSHSGNDILEKYINISAEKGRSCVCVGSGNEGISARHAGGTLEKENIVIEVVIGGLENSVNMQIWKDYIDDFDINIISPSRERVTINKNVNITSTYYFNNVELFINYGEPTPLSTLQEIYMVFTSTDGYIGEGVWEIELVPKKIVDGRFDMWLPTAETLNPRTKFLRPDANTTLTIPSTAENVITVSAYDASLESFAPFSGRGFTRNERIKPDISAPGVNIYSTAPNGGYTLKTGTSMATPFVTGSCALMMEWGIVRGNDPYLYGQKVKAYLIMGARQLPGVRVTPNTQTGWGALCLADSLPR